MAKKVTAEDYIVDFSKEESGAGGQIKVKEGMYRARIVAGKVRTSEKGTVGMELTLAFLDGKLRKQKKKLKETLWVSRKAYARFRTLCEALEIDVPKKLDIRKLIKEVKGKDVCIEVDTEKSEGYKDKSVVTWDGFLNIDDYEEESDDEDAEDLDEDADEDDDDEDEADDDDDDEEDDDLDDDEDEEEEEPVKKKKGKKKAPAKKSKKKKKAEEDDEDDDDDDLDLDDL